MTEIEHYHYEKKWKVWPEVDYKTE